MYWMCSLPWYIPSEEFGALCVHTGFLSGICLAKQNPRLKMNSFSALIFIVEHSRGVNHCCILVFVLSFNKNYDKAAQCRQETVMQATRIPLNAKAGLIAIAMDQSMFGIMDTPCASDQKQMQQHWKQPWQ
jgi:hypothetical protein